MTVAPAGGRRLLAGWGGTSPTAAEVRRPAGRQAVETLLGAGEPGAAAAGGMLPRGLGRSYGDAAQCAGGLVVDMTGLDRVLELDAAAGKVRVEAGASLDTLVRRLVPAGWFVPVTPGTRQVTVGGALAADVHGKNHHRDGSFARYVRRCTLATPAGVIDCGPAAAGAAGEAFWATAGGMGLTGVLTELELELLPVETAEIVVDTERAADLDECMALMEEGDAGYRYSVAWIDCMARGRSLGRSVLTRGDHATAADVAVAGGRRRPPAGDGVGPGPRLRVPLTPPLPLVSVPAVAAFNEAWFRRAPRRRRRSLETLAHFFHPLDGVAGWNRLYGPRGFLQYQFVLPFSAGDGVRTVLERLSRARVASFLAVLKRFGDGDGGMLSFPMPGWTLALDVPAATPGLAGLLDGLDELVAAAGGRVYLAKDGRLRPELLPAMYPRLAEWREIRHRLDPRRTLRSDLAVRLGLR